MKYSAMGLLGNAAASIENKDGGTAFALYELADNLAILMRGECTLDEFKEAYVGQDAPPFIVNGTTPSERRKLPKAKTGGGGVRL